MGTKRVYDIALDSYGETLDEFSSKLADVVKTDEFFLKRSSMGKRPRLDWSLQHGRFRFSSLYVDGRERRPVTTSTLRNYENQWDIRVTVRPRSETIELLCYEDLDEIFKETVKDDDLSILNKFLDNVRP